MHNTKNVWPQVRQRLTITVRYWWWGPQQSQFCRTALVMAVLSSSFPSTTIFFEQSGGNAYQPTQTTSKRVVFSRSTNLAFVVFTIAVRAVETPSEPANFEHFFNFSQGLKGCYRFFAARKPVFNFNNVLLRTPLMTEICNYKNMNKNRQRFKGTAKSSNSTEIYLSLTHFLIHCWH